MRITQWHPDTCGCRIDLELDEPSGEPRGGIFLRRCPEHVEISVVDLCTENRAWGLDVFPALQAHGLTDEEVRAYPKQHDPPTARSPIRPLRVVIPARLKDQRRVGLDDRLARITRAPIRVLDEA